MEKEGKSPQVSVSFAEAIPTKCHMALKALLDSGYIKYIVSQNIDGLHMKSGVKRRHLAELHGNMFVENCDKCRRYILNFRFFHHFYEKTEFCIGNVGNLCERHRHQQSDRSERVEYVRVVRVHERVVVDI